MDSIAGCGRSLGLQADHFMAHVNDGTGNIFQWFRTLETNFRDTAGGHFLDHQLGADEGHRTRLGGDVEENIRTWWILGLSIFIHAYDLWLAGVYFILKSMINLYGIV